MNQSRVRTAIAGLVVGGLALAGCGSPNPSAAAPPTGAASAGPASAAAAPTGASASPAAVGSASAGASLPTTGRIAVTDKGYAITLPAAWTRIDLGPNGMADIMKAGASALPEALQQTLASQVGQMAAAGVSIFALRQAGDSIPPGTTLNVISVPSPGLSIDLAESAIVGQLKSTLGSGTEIATARVSGPAGQFLRLSYGLKAGGASVATVQYLFFAPSKQIVITCATPGAIAAIQAECETIATSLEILN
jgi:hypothetical protein